MADVSATGRLALTDMRHLLGVLRSDGLAADREPQPQLSGLPRLLEGVRGTGLEVTFEQVGAPFEVPPGVELTVFRIVQESLTNVLKHAGEPTVAQVTLTFDAPFVDVDVRDDGNVDRTVGGSWTGRHERTGDDQWWDAQGRAEPRGWLGGEGSGEGRPVTIRVLLVDDQALLRKGFRMILEEEAGIEVVGEASGGEEAVALTHQLHPDVVLMDVRMPDMDGIEATAQIVRFWHRARVLILTTFDLDEYAFAGLRAGASGFLLKDVPPAGLISAIRVVARGDAVVSPRITRRLLDTFAHELPANASASGRP